MRRAGRGSFYISVDAPGDGVRVVLAVIAPASLPQVECLAAFRGDGKQSAVLLQLDMLPGGQDHAPGFPADDDLAALALRELDRRDQIALCFRHEETVFERVLGW